jgi:hypothetical protein
MRRRAGLWAAALWEERRRPASPAPLLIGVRQPDDAGLVKGAPQELQARGQALACEADGWGGRAQKGRWLGCGKPGEQGRAGLLSSRRRGPPALPPPTRLTGEAHGDGDGGRAGVRRNHGAVVAAMVIARLLSHPLQARKRWPCPSACWNAGRQAGAGAAVQRQRGTRRRAGSAAKQVSQRGGAHQRRRVPCGVN